MIKALDAKGIFDDISEAILPLLAQALREGWDDEKLLNHPKVQLLLTARAISMGIQERDSGRAMTAIKDLKDRSKGKPVERREIKHALANLKDEELDAKLLTLSGGFVEADDVE